MYYNILGNRESITATISPFDYQNHKKFMLIIMARKDQLNPKLNSKLVIPPMTTATSNQLFATIIISFAVCWKIIITMNLITMFKWLLNVYSYPNSPEPNSRIIAFKHSTQAFPATAARSNGILCSATCRRLFRDYRVSVDYLGSTLGLLGWLLWDYLGSFFRTTWLGGSFRTSWVAPLGLLFSRKI